MRVRESGMPEPDLWETFFDPPKILAELKLAADATHVVEFGCGYGTFTIPAAQIVNGTVTSLEIDETMVDFTRQRAKRSLLANAKVIATDFEQVDKHLSEGCADYVMLFNILHGDKPENLLHSAFRLLQPGSKGSLIHWNFDPETPRGPPMKIRPEPDNLQMMTADIGFIVSEKIDLPPYHYGFVFEKPRK